jgi:hypothetical protein
MSAGTPNRVRSRWIIDMLSPFLPRRTSLTRLAVPRIGIMSARESPVLIHQVANDVGSARWPSRPLALLIGRDQARLGREARDVGGLVGSHQPIDQSTRARARVAVYDDQGRVH